ncbi:MAG: hypothetical protein ABIK43_07075 [candidate division WOR-3 bacterium]
MSGVASADQACGLYVGDCHAGGVGVGYVFFRGIGGDSRGIVDGDDQHLAIPAADDGDVDYDGYWLSCPDVGALVEVRASARLSAGAGIPTGLQESFWHCA